MAESRHQKTKNAAMKLYKAAEAKRLRAEAKPTKECEATAAVRLKVEAAAKKERLKAEAIAKKEREEAEGTRLIVEAEVRNGRLKAEAKARKERKRERRGDREARSFSGYPRHPRLRARALTSEHRNLVERESSRAEAEERLRRRAEAKAAAAEKVPQYQGAFDLVPQYGHRRATAAVSPQSHTHRYTRSASFSKRHALAIDP